MAHVDDKREHGGRPALGYVVCTDSFMSGWGHAVGGRSLIAFAIANWVELDNVMENAAARDDFKRPRHVTRTRADGTPAVQLGPRDHLSVRDAESAGRMYQRGGFAK